VFLLHFLIALSRIFFSFHYFHYHFFDSSISFRFASDFLVSSIDFLFIISLFID